jgi:CheY-like chemotaxis protein
MRNDFELPDLFIIDKQLSGVDGLELCRFLKMQETTRNIPVIIISASPYISTQAINAGADEFVEKPFKIKELLSIVQKHILNN